MAIMTPEEAGFDDWDFPMKKGDKYSKKMTPARAAWLELQYDKYWENQWLIGELEWLRKNAEDARSEGFGG